MMKKILISAILASFFFPILSLAAGPLPSPANFRILQRKDSATLTWKNPSDFSFSEVILFRSTIPIESYFNYEAVEGFYDKIYTGTEEIFTDIGLAQNLAYYYVLFAKNNSGEYSKAVLKEKDVIFVDSNSNQGDSPKDLSSESTSNAPRTLAGATSQTVNRVSQSEAGLIYNYNQPVTIEPGDNTQKLALFIIVRSPHDLSDSDKNSISYFIKKGTATTIVLGSGERAGVLNSYMSVFDKLPRTIMEWQDIIKIANGRWPDQRNLDSEERAANEYFSAIYQRTPNMDNSNDNAAVTVIAYGLRPGNRDMEAEKNAIKIYRSIFDKAPVEASDWDLVRAIAYSGATR